MMRLKKNNKTSIEKAMKDMQNFNEVHYLPTSKIAIGLVLVFILADFMFIRQLIEGYFTDTVYMIWLSSAVIALLIDISPSILAGCISAKNKNIWHYIGMGTTVILLSIVFALLAELRINSEDIIYSTASTQIISTVNAEITALDTKNSGESWMSLLFCIMPVFTSIVSFVIGIFDNNLSRVLYTGQLHFYQLDRELIDIEANNLEMETELKRDLIGRNQRLKELELSNLNAKEAITKEKLKLRMAMAVGTPQALSDIMEQKL